MIPKGWCQCGCGNKTAIAKESDASKHWVKGEPVRMLTGHGKKRHWDKYIVDPATGCWNWTGPLDKAGYSKSIQIGGRGSKTEKPYRYFYLVLVGPIPEGFDLDHICRNRKCISPFHLEPVTPTENNRRKITTKLSVLMAKEIRSLLSDGVDGKEIAQKYGVVQSVISSIKNGSAWK